MLSKEEMIDYIVDSDVESMDLKSLIRFYIDATSHEMLHFWTDEEVKEAYSKLQGEYNE